MKGRIAINQRIIKFVKNYTLKIKLTRKKMVEVVVHCGCCGVPNAVD